MTALDNSKSSLAEALLPYGIASEPHLNVLELGTGCGMVGIAIAQTVSNSKVLLTDLPEAREIVERNIDSVVKAPGASLSFMELDWDADLPGELQSSSEPLDLILAADCTYNPDSSPALVKTLARLSRANPKVRVAIAMKMRHSSEEGFFKLMSDAGFLETDKMEFPLPGDVQVGEETVYLHVYYRAFFAPT
ncbi:uncharacterized protein J4E84_003667 [Alternaria hordeiaustralica]|uniref:uncharacterized protein n=1 Tax=Alternaria hordeiaustralica TaxID=1187925 RepID=UPI0020C4FBD6|nr:uncharacterized protein J4E84_003667 [Alternaria hordeiaustralica]KAI4691374.1 hypothetical protein J4E84_003667 [Alternaria hordeiaustralica]